MTTKKLDLARAPDPYHPAECPPKQREHREAFPWLDGSHRSRRLDLHQRWLVKYTGVRKGPRRWGATRHSGSRDHRGYGSHCEK